jgi:hypothetical protein
MSIEWQPKDQPIYQNTDTFQQLVDKLNLGRTQLDSDLAYLDSAFGPLPGSSTFALTGITTTAKSLIDAINEHDIEIGVISTLGTTDKSNLVAAINEIDAVFDASGNQILGTSNFNIHSGSGGHVAVLAHNGTFRLYDNSGAPNPQYAVFKSSVQGHLYLYSGVDSRNALRFYDGDAGQTNAQFYGKISLPETGTGSISSSEITSRTVHGAIDQVNARIPNVYNAAGTLLNP